MKIRQISILFCRLLIFTGICLVPVNVQAASPCNGAPNSSIKAEDLIACLRSGQPINIDNAQIDGDLDLTSLQNELQNSINLTSPLVITNSHLTGSLKAFDGDTGIVTVFQNKVDFRGSRFDGIVDFTGAAFKEFAHFDKSYFNSSANFTQAIFQEGASFDKSIFNASSSFMLASISGGIDFSDARFRMLTNFSMLHSTQSTDPMLKADVFFSGAQFTGNVYFMDAVFENSVHFNDAIFHREAPEDLVNFDNATFSILDLKNARFENKQLELNTQNYKKLIMPNFQPSILSFQNDLERLSFLEENFRTQQRLDIANNIAYWRLCILRNDQPPFIQALQSIFLDWTFGYGYKPMNAVWTSVLLILFFSIFYYPQGILHLTPLAPEKPRERKWSFRLSEIPITQEDDHHETQEEKSPTSHIPPAVLQVLPAIAFSFGVFTKISSGKYIAVRARSIVIAEWILGLMMMAGLLFSLANTNPLIRSILGWFG